MIPAITRRFVFAALLAGAFGVRGVFAQTGAADRLPSWNDGPAKAALFAFVERVTRASSSSYVKPRERVATFDNDGTLWAEQPNETGLEQGVSVRAVT